MILNDKQIESFKEAAEPLMKWLGDNLDQHISVHVTNMRAELSEGVCSHKTEDFIKD